MGLIAWFKKQRNWRRDHVAAFSAATRKHADGLTLFQHDAMSALARFVAPDRFRRAAMKDEDGEYLLALVGTNGAEVYVYPNEAAISKPDIVFEEWAYRTPTELLQDLAKECASRVA
jgi:hypothetical protein